MIVNLISDVNTESVLKAFSAHSSLSIVQFYEGSYFNNVTESNYSGLKLRKTIDSLLSGGFIANLNDNDSNVWRITSKGLDHLAFLERPDVKEIPSVKNVEQNVRPFKRSETGSIIRRDVKFILQAIYTLASPIVSRNQKAQ